MQPIILASQSPQRQAILATLGVPFTAQPADIDEQAITAATQHLRAKKIAQAKAYKIQALNPEAIILAGDTYVIHQDRVLEKPQTLIEAKEMLQYQSGKTLETVTGFCYLDAVHQIEYAETISTIFTFRELSETEINYYVANEPVLTWSAAFCPAYNSGMALVASSSGSFTGFTHGLPLEVVSEQLRLSGMMLK